MVLVNMQTFSGSSDIVNCIGFTELSVRMTQYDVATFLGSCMAGLRKTVKNFSLRYEPGSEHGVPTITLLHSECLACQVN
jgi:hypothetical protein